MGTTYELRKPVFIYYSTLFDSYVLEAPGRSTRVPYSVELFEEYGAEWRQHDRNHMYRTSEKRGDEMLGVLYPGAKITIVGMSKKPAVWFDVWVAMAQIDDSQYEGIAFQLTGLLRDCSTDEPRVNPEYLRAVDTEDFDLAEQE